VTDADQRGDEASGGATPGEHVADVASSLQASMAAEGGVASKTAAGRAAVPTLDSRRSITFATLITISALSIGQPEGTMKHPRRAHSGRDASVMAEAILARANTRSAPRSGTRRVVARQHRHLLEVFTFASGETGCTSPSDPFEARR
jgi:hypothetical protein